MVRDQWEVELEDALLYASPVQVLTIIAKVKGWLVGYCETCGVWNDVCGGKSGCECEWRGEWWNK
jgi:hypothetical protein